MKELLVGATKPLVPGSRSLACSTAQCTAMVWIAPSGQKALSDGRVRVICEDCFLLQFDPGSDSINMLPEALQEIRIQRNVKRDH